MSTSLPHGEAPAPNFFRDKIYKDAAAAGKPVPWDIRRHQPEIERASAVFSGKVLDVGCGLGDNARWISSLDSVTSVTAVDFSEEAIREAISRGDSEKVKFLNADVFELDQELGVDKPCFDVLLDSAVFHCIGDDDTQRRYLASVSSWVKPGGRLVMLVFSDLNQDPWVGPRRISPDHARNLWTEAGWNIDTLENDAFYLDVIGRNEGKGGHALIMTATKL